MKKFSLFAMVLLGSAAVYADAVIDQVIVRQQWPWSTDVKVEYRISGATNAVSIGVEAFNGGVPLDGEKLASAISGTLYGITGDVVGEFTIDPVKAFGDTGYVALANFKVKLTLRDDPGAGEVLYKIYDLDHETGTFPCTDVTRADLLNGKYGTVETNFGNIGPDFATSLSDVVIWTGVTNRQNAKTTELVMRKIPASGKTFRMGQAEIATAVHDVTLTKDYYIGVFPVTQMQYKMLSRNNSWQVKDEARPVGAGAYYSGYKAVVVGGISANLGVAVDFPTEAQWEYACRAGTTSDLYTGKSLSTANVTPIGWWYNSTTSAGNSDNHAHDVGLLAPNAYGLYDMIGNVYEACSDFWDVASNLPGYSDGSPVTDPTGPASATRYLDNDPGKAPYYVMRGGYFGLSNSDLTSAGRNGNAGNWDAYGFRLAFTVGE